MLAQVGAGETCGLVGGHVSVGQGLFCSALASSTSTQYGCVIVATDIPKLNFGKNAAMSGDGNWIAISEDYIGGIFVFGR